MLTLDQKKKNQAKSITRNKNNNIDKKFKSVGN